MPGRTTAPIAVTIAAIQALREAGLTPPGARATWSHDQLQATFTRELINRRKRYPSGLRDVLPRVYKLRQNADYTRDMVSARCRQLVPCDEHAVLSKRFKRKEAYPNEQGVHA